ncbi:MAG: HIT family protein [Myxococcota bacterium]
MSSKDCTFCAIAGGSLPAEVVYQDGRFIAFLDTRPVFLGHTLIVPRAHIDDIFGLDAALHGPLLGLAQAVSRALVEGLGCQGVFLAMNNRVSQSVPHLHLHAVPRSKGDGLRGFFWPRQKYPSDVAREEVAAKIRASLPRIE